MKRLLSAICLMAVLLLAGCNSENEQPFTRLWLSSNEATEVRGGYFIDPNTEAGITAAWWGDGEEPKKIGGYGISHLRNVKIEVPNIIVMQGLPETLVGYPFFGAEIYRDCEKERTAFSPLGGATVNPFFVEGGFNTVDSIATLKFGLYWEFK